MPLPIKSFEQMTKDQVTAMQAVSSLILDFSEGSIFLAEIESNSGVVMWLQAMAQILLAIARLQTSTGENVDTFVEQFGLTRNPATFASGNVTFSRFTPTVQSIIPVGSLVSSVANGISYAVFADTTNPYYDPTQNAYIMNIGISSISVPVQAQTAGSIGNVLSNQITTISSVLIGVDNVTNPDPFTNGEDQESDSALKIRFVDYLNGLFKATEQALAAAILSVDGVARYKLIENEDTLGDTDYGFFYAVVDDGSGNASPTLLANVSAAIEGVRAFTIQYAVYGPTQFPISISAHVFTDGTVPDATVQDEVVAALQEYIISQSFDALYPYSKIPEIIYSADSSIINVTNYTLNGGTSDVLLTGTEIGVPGTITVTMNV